MVARRGGMTWQCAPSTIVMLIAVFATTNAQHAVQYASRPNDLHLVRHVHDVFSPPTRGAYVYTLKLPDSPRQGPLLDWAMSSILSLNDTAPAHDIVVLLDAPPNATLDAQLHAVGAKHVHRVQHLVERLPAHAATLYAQMLQSRNQHANYPGALLLSIGPNLRLPP